MSARLTPLLCHLRRLAAPAADSDETLLARYAQGRDEAAFTALVRRHGPMVQRVCRRVLADAHAAEDCFQTTFLTLARRAASVRRPAALAAWLHAVALRAALKVRARGRRHGGGLGVADLPDRRPEPLAEVTARDLLAAVDEEVARLPEAYRLPVLLVCLEGLSQEEAAHRLGWTAGQVKGRLERGRKRLHARLLKRGLSLPAALAAVELSGVGVGAGVPARLAGAVTGVAFAATADSAASGLAEGAAPGLVAGRAKLAVVLAGLLGVAALSAAPLMLREAPPAGVAPTTHGKTEPKAGEMNRAGADLYGDPLPPGAVVRLGTVRFRHAEGVTCCAFTPDGRALVTGSHDGTLRLWERATGKELRRFVGHRGAVRRLALSPDGRLLASWGAAGWGDPPGLIRLWDVATAVERGRLAGPKEVESVVWAPDGTQLAVGGGDGTVRLYDPARREPMWSLRWHGKGVRGLAFSPGGDRLASCGQDGTVCLADLNGPHEPRRLRGPEREFHLVAFRRGGRELLTCGDRYGPEIGSKVPSVNTVAAWDAGTGRRLRDFRVGDDSPADSRGSTGWALSADGATLALGYRDHTVRLWDVVAGKALRTLDGFPDRFYPAYALAWAPDGKALAAAGSHHAVCLLDPATGRRLPPAGVAHDSNPRVVALSPDGSRVATGSHDQTVILWDSATGRPLRRFVGHRGWVYAVALAPDGRALVSGGSDGVVIRWDAATGKESWRLDLGRAFALEDFGKLRAGRVSGLAFSPAGGLLALGLDWQGDCIRLIETATGKERRGLAAPGLLFGGGPLSFSADGAVLTAVCGDGTVRRWRVADGREVSRLACHRGEAAIAVGISPGGELAAVADPDGRVHVWDVAAARVVRELRQRGAARGRRLAFSADGRYLAVCATSYGQPTRAEDLRVELWELRSGQRVWGRRLPPLTGVSAAALSTDGRRLVTTLADTTALVWDLTPAPPAGVPGRVQDWWAALAGADAAEAWRAMAALAARPAVAVALLKERLERGATNREHVMRQITNLDSKQFTVRQRAARELEKLADRAEPMLRAALAGRPPLEVRRRLEGLLERLDRDASSERLRALRAVEVLERIATPEAVRVLEPLASGALGTRLTREARTALERLQGRKTSAR